MTQRRDKADVLMGITDRVLMRVPRDRPRPVREREAWDTGVRYGRALIRAYAYEALTVIAAALEANDPDWARELAELFVILFRPDDERRR